MENKIKIKDEDLIKITKIRDYEIIFKFFDKSNGKYYLCLLHENSSKDCIKEFYIKEIDENGNKNGRKFKFISQNTIYKPLLDYFFKEANVKKKTYKSLNKNYFIFQLTKAGFASSIYNDEVRQQKECLEELKSHLYKLEAEKAKVIKMIESLE